MGASNVLLIVDMLTNWQYEGAGDVAVGAPEAVTAINRARRSGARVVYANDLDGGFHGSRERTFEMAMAGRHPELVAPLEPEEHEDFIHKGQHSAFYGTPLAHLLDVGEAKNVILAGQVTEQCILYTALDARVRGYGVTVLTDAVLCQYRKLGDAALEMIDLNMEGTLITSHELADRMSSPATSG
jgi:nicotinamidase-related amidase